MIDPLSKSEIKELYNKLSGSSSFTPQARGREFEKIIYSVLYHESLDPRTSFRPKGEEVDGSFFWRGQTFLLEAKWHKDPLPASSIYSFKGKLDGKFHTTSGVFLSMNGFSDEVEDALKFGKSLNILLFDEKDLTPIFNGNITFEEILKFKLRQAGDTGSIYAHYEHIIIPKAYKDFVVYVEGYDEFATLSYLLKPINKKYGYEFQIQILKGAHNIRQLPSLISLHGNNLLKAAIVVLDKDQDNPKTETLISTITDQIKSASVSIPIRFLFADDSSKEKAESASKPEEFESLPLFNQIEGFVQEIAEDYYDPEIDIPIDTIKKIVSNLDWDFNNGTVSIEVDDDHSSSTVVFNDTEELVEFIDEAVIEKMHGEMPSYWLDEKVPLDYTTDVQEYLFNNHYDDLMKLNWDTDNL